MAIPYLQHQDRVEAIHEHVEFFSALEASHYEVTVPACPEWTVEDALRHVCGGALTVCAWVERVDDVDLDPVAVLRESDSFSSSAPLYELTPWPARYVELLGSCDEHSETYLFNERVPLGKQVWHATGDWGIHRHDVEVALGRTPSLTAERAGDLIGGSSSICDRSSRQPGRGIDRPGFGSSPMTHQSTLLRARVDRAPYSELRRAIC